MINEELLKELNLNEEQTKKLNDAFEKFGQSEADKVRTDYSAKLKTANDELTKYKPIEKSETEKELEQAKQELANMKFKQTLSDAKIPETLMPFLKTDSDVSKLTEALKGFSPVTKNSYIPKNNAGSEGITKEQFKKLSIVERQKIYDESPDLYQQLKS